MARAWHVLRANQLWAPNPANDPDGARRSIRRFYALVAASRSLSIDARLAERLEVEWWRVHRAPQHDPGVETEQLIRALSDLYAYLYAAPPDSMRAAALHRTEAMDLSDAWVAAVCRTDDPLLAAERRALVASYTALLDAVQRRGQPDG